MKHGVFLLTRTLFFLFITNSEKKAGIIGAPRSGCEVKLVDVADMNYRSTDQPYPRGEICLRGGHIIDGYYKDEKNTRDAIDDEGWLHTGDIGTVDEVGRFTIIDRKKNIFKVWIIKRFFFLFFFLECFPSTTLFFICASPFFA